MAKTWWKSEHGGDWRCRGAVQSVPHSRGHGRPPYPAVWGIFLPLALTFLLRGVMLSRPRDNALAGAMIGLGALSYWYYGVFFGCAVILGLAAWSQRPVGRATASSPSGRSR